jgi:exosortase A
MNVAPISSNWRSALALTFFCVGVLVTSYWSTVFSILEIWRRSETFAHGFLILPISVYLIILKRHTLAALCPEPRLLPLVLLTLTTSVWLISHLVEVQVLEQYAFVAMVPLLVWTILGYEVTNAIAFPLIFLFFAVPAGEILNPALMQLTADSVVFLLNATGIPVQREGLFLSLPTGRWAVVEACSGLRYLIASTALGCLFAYLAYQSWKKRAILIIAAVILPIVGNCMRAYVIVMIGHATDMKLAAGIDHLIYGWFFFALLIAPLFIIGIRFTDRDRQGAASRTRPANRRTPQKMIATSFAALAIFSTAPTFAAYSERSRQADPVTLIAPGAENGWQQIANAHVNYAPHYPGARSAARQSYRKGSHRVELFIAYYHDQRAGAEMITSQNGVVSPDDRVWRKIGETFASRPIPLNVTELTDSSNHRLVVWHWYWVNGRFTASQIGAKILQISSQLLHGKDDAATILIFSENRSALTDFVSDIDISTTFSDGRSH